MREVYRSSPLPASRIAERPAYLANLLTETGRADFQLHLQISGDPGDRISSRSSAPGHPALPSSRILSSALLRRRSEQSVHLYTEENAETPSA
jgi:hypothetical protein